MKIGEVMVAFIDILKNRADKIEKWLDENHPECMELQEHLDLDTPERAYWHYGYVAALNDVLKLLNRNLTSRQN
ncbi:MAG: hypothetical protein A2W25_17615 [candidate division Zixibacteria bacterium RBG_16_53_22]|nr:MAG: hypothetical protein A2W25_17615 [candidate division Zixibacteria bacterium RBG_16_53_22]